MVHNDCALLVVDLSIDSGISDQIDNPLLALILVQAQSRAQILDVDSLMDLAVALGDQMSGSLDKAICGRNEEEIGTEHLLGFGEFLLRLLEIEIDVERLDEVGYRVLVFVVLLLDNTDDILELLLVLSGVSCAVSVGDDSCCEVSEDPRAGGLNRVYEWCGEEEFANGVTASLVVEEREQSPVNEPCSVGELCEWVAEELGIDRFLDLLHLLHSNLPVCGKDLRRELSPCSGGNLVIIGGENSELVEEFGSCLVVSAAVLEVSKVVQNIDHVEGNLIIVSK